MKKPQNLLRNIQYHHNEISICGFSGSGKTTLLEKLIATFSKKYAVGYAKSDAHHFHMDHKKKDTSIAWEAGAKAVHIFDSKHNACIKQGNMDMAHKRTVFENCDFVLVEGQKYSSISKLVMLGGKDDIIPLVKNGEITNVIAFIGKGDRPNIPLECPYFDRNNIHEISKHISDFFAKKSAQKINGLVLTGGQSSRMKTDKAMLSLQGKTQLQRTAELLKPFCDQVFISTRPEQRDKKETSNFPIIEDRFLQFGPLSGILSAQMHTPESAWLVTACDLPFLNSNALEMLIKKRNSFKLATTYKSSSDGMPEPLCAIYEPRSFMRFMQFIAIGYSCPRKMLLNSSVEIITAQKKNALMNMNYPEDLAIAKKQIADNQ